MKKLTRIFIITVLLAAGSNTTALAEGEGLRLSVSRTWGYAGFDDGIQGYFTFSVKGPENLQTVQFLLDGNVVLEKMEPPFEFKFNTDNYEKGVHTLKALGTLGDGTQISSNSFTRRFVPPIGKRLFRGIGLILVLPLILIAIIDWVLKVVGMWKAARRTQTAWFICLLIFNTMCILPVIYFFTAGKKPETLEKPRYEI